MVDEAKDLGKEILKDAKEVVIERFFSPMYFYFIMAWIIYNWTFVYSLLFVDSTKLKKYKLDYLLSFYPTSAFWDYAHNFWYVLLGPALSTYVLIWWISIWSEKSFKRFEEYKLNKKTIKRLLEYKEKVKIAKEEREIRDQESDKPEIRYNDNPEFNKWFDSSQEIIKVGKLTLTPSEVLFSTDFASYKVALEEYNNRDIEEEEGL
jgi:predicted membrane protein